MVLDKIRRAFSESMPTEELSEDYLEIDFGAEEKDHKIMVKLFVLKNYDDVTEILNALREGYTIAMIDIKYLRKKDSIELKRAISKIKKTADALDGNIAGFGEHMVIVTPSFAKIHKHPLSREKEDTEKSRFDY